MRDNNTFFFFFCPCFQIFGAKHSVFSKYELPAEERIVLKKRSASEKEVLETLYAANEMVAL